MLLPETGACFFFLLVLSHCRLLKGRSLHTDVPLVFDFLRLVSPGVTPIDCVWSGQLTDDQIVLYGCCGSD